MPTFKLSTFFITEASLYLIGGLGLWYFQILPANMLLLTLFIIALGTRILIILATFLIGWLSRSVPPSHLKINLFQTIKLVFSELWAFLILSGVSAFERWSNKQQAVTDLKKPPVLLIHGFFCNGAYWSPMQRYLKKYGISPIFTLNLEPIFADIEQFSQQLARRVADIRAITGADKVILVSHSMGGLVSRVYLYQLGGHAFVEKLITLGSPHQGTVLAYVIGGMNVKQMRPQNTWLKALAQSEAQQETVPTTCIYSCHDNFIAPQDSAKLDYAKNRPIAGIGHIEMMISKDIQRFVCEEIILAYDAILWRKQKPNLPRSLVMLVNKGIWPNTGEGELNQHLNPLLGKEAAQKLSQDNNVIHLFRPPFATIAEEATSTSIAHQFWLESLTNVGEIDYEQSLIIADFGIGSDSPIILNYEHSQEPRVMYLKWFGSGEHTWVCTHESFDAFAYDVGLIERPNGDRLQF